MNVSMDASQNPRLWFPLHKEIMSYATECEKLLPDYKDVFHIPRHEVIRFVTRIVQILVLYDITTEKLRKRLRVMCDFDSIANRKLLTIFSS